MICLYGASLLLRHMPSETRYYTGVEVWNLIMKPQTRHIASENRVFLVASCIPNGTWLRGGCTLWIMIFKFSVSQVMKLYRTSTVWCGRVWLSVMWNGTRAAPRPSARSLLVWKPCLWAGSPCWSCLFVPDHLVIIYCVFVVLLAVTLMRNLCWKLVLLSIMWFEQMTVMLHEYLCTDWYVTWVQGHVTFSGSYNHPWILLTQHLGSQSLLWDLRVHVQPLCKLRYIKKGKNVGASLYLKCSTSCSSRAQAKRSPASPYPSLELEEDSFPSAGDKRNLNLAQK